MIALFKDLLAFTAVGSFTLIAVTWVDIASRLV